MKTPFLRNSLVITLWWWESHFIICYLCTNNVDEVNVWRRSKAETLGMIGNPDSLATWTSANSSVLSKKLRNMYKKTNFDWSALFSQFLAYFFQNTRMCVFIKEKYQIPNFTIKRLHSRSLHSRNYFVAQYLPAMPQWLLQQFLAWFF